MTELKAQQDILNKTMELNSVIDEITKAKTYLAKIQNDAKVIKDTQNLERDAIVKLKNDSDNEIANKKSELQKQISEQETYFATKQNDILAKESYIDGKIIELHNFEASLHKKQEELNKIAQEYEDISVKILENTKILQSIDKIKTDIIIENKKNEQLLKDISNTSEKNNTLLQKINDQKLDIQTKQEEMDKTININNQILNENKNILQKMEQLRADIDKKEQDIAKKQQEIDSQKAINDEKEYNLTILDLDLQTKQKRIIQQSKLYNLTND